jgi:hypothetical protein
MMELMDDAVLKGETGEGGVARLPSLAVELMAQPLRGARLEMVNEYWLKRR